MFLIENEDEDFDKSSAYEITNEKRSKKDEKLILEALQHLKRERAEDYNDWISICWGLKNSGYSYKIFQTFSRRSKRNYNEDACYKLFHAEDKKKERKKITIGTILQMLKKDDIEFFRETIIGLKKEEYEDLEFKENQQFSIHQMIFYIQQDQDKFKGYFASCLEMTHSFNYFNHFHVMHEPFATIFCIDEDTPKMLQGNSYAQFRVNGYPFLALWKINLAHRAIRRFIFNPNLSLKNNEDEYNFFDGFKFKRHAPNMKLIEPFFDHIHHLFNGIEIEINYNHCWFAHIIQKPWIKTRVALVLVFLDSTSRKRFGNFSVGKDTWKICYKINKSR